MRRGHTKPPTNTYTSAQRVRERKNAIEWRRISSNRFVQWMENATTTTLLWPYNLTHSLTLAWSKLNMPCHSTHTYARARAHITHPYWGRATHAFVGAGGWKLYVRLETTHTRHTTAVYGSVERLRLFPSFLSLFDYACLPVRLSSVCRGIHMLTASRVRQHRQRTAYKFRSVTRLCVGGRWRTWCQTCERERGSRKATRSTHCSTWNIPWKLVGIFLTAHILGWYHLGWLAWVTGIDWMQKFRLDSNFLKRHRICYSKFSRSWMLNISWFNKIILHITIFTFLIDAPLNSN